MKIKLLLALAAAALGLSAPAFAAAASAAPKAADARGAYVLTDGDRIQISVTGQQDVSTMATISAAGTVTMRYVDEIKIAGKTVAQAQETIEQTYIDKQILKRPEVIVTVETFKPRYVYVTGEANKKENILFPMDTPKPMTLVELVKKAGYSTDARLSRVEVFRKKADGTVERLGPFDVEGFMRGRNKSPGIDIDLQPDDTVNIPIRVI